MTEPHVMHASNKISAFIRKLKFRKGVNQTITSRKNAKFVLLDLVFIWRNKTRSLTVKERQKWYYYRWLISARKSVKEEFK